MSDIDDRWTNHHRLAPTNRKKGRKSAASFGIVPPDVRVLLPDPPQRFTAEEKEVWRENVSSLRPGWFSGSKILLELFCRAVVHERMLSQRLASMDPTDPHYSSLEKMQRGAAMLVANFATRLRLTPRSTIDRSAPKLVSSLPKPWDDEPPAA
jgi:hypothetical protein